MSYEKRLSGSALREMFQHAGLFAMPSYHEGLSLALLEAMSCVLSCIASDIPANRTARLAEKLNYFINHLLTETESRGQAACVTRHFDWDRISEQTLGVYVSILSRKKEEPTK